MNKSSASEPVTVWRHFFIMNETEGYIKEHWSDIYA